MTLRMFCPRFSMMRCVNGLNNLQDISIDSRYADICGISETELKHYFGESVKELAEANRLTEDGCYEKLARMYNGYHFCEDSIGVYNPFSLLNTFAKMKFGEYWFETGTPSFLVRYLQQGNYNLAAISGDGISKSRLAGVNYANPEPVTLMYQSGYLTIREYDERFCQYDLDYPNEEVKSGFLNSLSQLYAPDLIDSDERL